MPKKYNIDHKDIAVFKKAVKGTKPLAQTKIRLKPSQDREPLRKHIQREFKDEIDHLSEKNDLAVVGSEEFIAYKQASISNKTLRKLRKGQYNVEATLDLHGMSVAEAKVAVEQFLRECLQQNIRVIVVIHGKGKHNTMPILKNKLNHWLRDINCVLAFCSASSLHGRHGALYALLKRSTQLE